MLQQIFLFFMHTIMPVVRSALSPGLHVRCWLRPKA